MQVSKGQVRPTVVDIYWLPSIHPAFSGYHQSLSLENHQSLTLGLSGLDGLTSTHSFVSGVDMGSRPEWSKYPNTPKMMIGSEMWADRPMTLCPGIFTGNIKKESWVMGFQVIFATLWKDSAWKWNQHKGKESWQTFLMKSFTFSDTALPYLQCKWHWYWG